MFVDKLPNHPEYKSVPPAEKKEIKKKRDEVCRKAEEIKVRLREKYQAEHEAYLIEKVSGRVTLAAILNKITTFK